MPIGERPARGRIALQPLRVAIRRGHRRDCRCRAVDRRGGLHHWLHHLPAPPGAPALLLPNLPQLDADGRADAVHRVGGALPSHRSRRSGRSGRGRRRPRTRSTSWTVASPSRSPLKRMTRSRNGRISQRTIAGTRTCCRCALAWKTFCWLAQHCANAEPKPYTHRATLRPTRPNGRPCKSGCTTRTSPWRACRQSSSTTTSRCSTWRLSLRGHERT